MRRSCLLAVACVSLVASAATARADANALAAAEKAGRLEFVQLGSAWHFKADPANEGVAAKWFAPESDLAKQPTTSVDRRGWVMGGFKHYSGWAWCRQDIDVPAALLARKHCALLFAAVDEECVVYLNGAKACEHTATATGIAPGRLWNAPFVVAVKPHLASAGKLAVVVRVHSPAHMGGVRKPAFLVSSDAALDAASLYDFFVLKRKLAPIKRDYLLADIPPVPPSPQQAQFGLHIQRTMTLLATSNAQRRNRVRILFYGQSIVVGMHWRQIVNALRQRFPYAVIECEDRAIGGFTAPALIHTAYHDLYPVDADLVVFHVYGGEKRGQLEDIIAGMRKQNTSDIMVYTHQIAYIDNDKGMARRTASDDASAEKMRELAKKYDCELVEVREEWRRYLKVNKLGANELIGNKVKSNVHPNVEGHTLLAQLVLRHFQYHPDNPNKFAAAIQTVKPGNASVSFTGPPWQTTPQGWLGRDPKSALKLAFVGNRVDALAFPAKGLGTAKILIDGKSPSQFAELYRCTRPSSSPFVWWPGLRQVRLGDGIAPRAETWTLTLSNVDTAKRTFDFTLKGSVTGDDGSGSRGKDFVSKSGRIRFRTRDFTVIGALRYRKKECPAGFQIKWEVKPLFVDPWQPRVIPDPAVEETTTLFKLLPPGAHTLEIVPNGDGVLPVAGLVVHNPPLR